jgi:hypothetical protein
VKRLRALIALAGLCGAFACSTTKTPGAPPITVPAVCSDAATHVAALDILSDVETALTSVSFNALLTGLIGTVLKDGTVVTFDAVKCAVIEVWQSAKLKAEASSDPLETTKATHASQWLADHAVAN